MEGALRDFGGNYTEGESKNLGEKLEAVKAALAAIGLNTDFKALCKSGAKPMLHGFIISLLVVLVAIGVEYMLGIAPTGTLA